MSVEPSCSSDTRARRYRKALLAAVPVGAVLGAIPGLGLVVEGARAQQGPSPLYVLLLFCGAGAAAALLAAVGASIGATIAGRGGQRRVSYLPIGIGAGLTVALAGLLLGAISATAANSWEWYSLEIAITFAAAIGSAVAAIAVTALAAHRPAPHTH